MTYPNWSRAGSGASSADLTALQASQATQDVGIANNLAAVTSAQTDLDTAEAALVTAQADIVAINADNATQTELDAAQAAQGAAQALVDAAQDALATTRQTAQDALEAEVDGIIANTGESVPIGGRVLPLDDPRPYINNTAAAITLTGDTAAAVLGDGLELDVLDVSGLRGEPVADNAALTALTAKDYERRKVSADGKEYVFEFGAVSGTLADDGATGFWQEQTFSFESTKIDANAGVVLETLAASTNAGTVRLFTNIDLTNAATLAVQSGETLNGVTDGTFLFSNYAAGTQFRADEVSGGWVVSVVGANTQTDLEWGELYTTTSSTASFLGGTTVMGGVWSPTTDSGIQQTAEQDGTTPAFNLKAGKKYLLVFNGTVSHSAANNYAYARFRDFTAGVNIGPLSQSHHDAGQASGRTGWNLQVAYQPSVDSTVGLTLVHASGGTTTITGTAAYTRVRVQELPSTEAVLAGMVTPTDNFMRAGSKFSTDDANETFTFDTPFSTTDGTTDADIQVILQRKNQAGIGLIIAPQNITVNGFDVNRDNSIDGVGTAEPFSYIAVNTSNLAKTVVMPEALEVEDLEIPLFARQTGLTGASAYALDSETWNGLTALGIEKVRFDLTLDITVSNDHVFQSYFVDVADLQNSNVDQVLVRHEHGAALLDISIADPTSGAFVVSGFSTIDTYDIRVVGIKAQKTVISTTDLNPDFYISGNSVPDQEYYFGKSGAWFNNSGGALTVPATPDAASLTAAGFSRVTGFI